MAKVPLRAYNREIETMIDRGQLDEAIAHCHHIFKTFPKLIACLARRILNINAIRKQWMYFRACLSLSRTIL